MPTSRGGRRARQAAWTGAIALGLMMAAAGRPAAQMPGLPPDARAAIDAAIQRSRAPDPGAPGTDRAAVEAAESALSAAVIGAIARHPNAVSPIVRAAVGRAPAYRRAIVERASAAYPGFAPQIAAAASTAARPSPPSPPPSAIAPSAAAPPTPMPERRRVRTAAPPPRVTEIAAAGPPPRARAGPLGISELRIGLSDHDTGVFGDAKEDGPDVALQIRFASLTGGFWDTLLQPRPTIGANINTEGDTSAFYGGLTWDWTLWGPVFFSFTLGGTVHDGETETLDPDRKELGSRVLFHLGGDLGVRFLEHHSLALHLDHMSNAKLADENDGLDTVGILYGYSF